MSIPLNDETKKQIIDLHKSGKSRTAIKKITGYSLPTIRKVIREFDPDEIREGNYANKQATSDDVSELINLYNSGYSATQAAELIGYSKRWALKTLAENSVEIRGLRNSVAPEHFVTTWQQASNVDEVMDLLGLTKRQALSRYYAYRKKGVPLKKLKMLKSSKPVADWSDLVNLADLLNEDENDV